MYRDCVCITAYKGVEELRALLGALHTDFDCYVHVDDRAWGRFRCLRPEFGDVMFSHRYAVKWGGIEHLEAVLLLLKESRGRRYRYIHIISGEDYPVLPNKGIREMFEGSDKNYVGFELATGRGNHANRRWRYYWPYVRFSWDYRNSLVRILDLLFVGMQVLFPFFNKKKIGDLEEIYWGFVWGSYTREAVECILDYLEENPRFMEGLRWCKIPEELCFQTILVHSGLGGSMVNDNRRFWDMGRGDGSGPVYLEEEDIGRMEMSGAVFARKVRYGSSVSTYLARKRMDRGDQR